MIQVNMKFHSSGDPTAPNPCDPELVGRVGFLDAEGDIHSGVAVASNGTLWNSTSHPGARHSGVEIWVEFPRPLNRLIEEQARRRAVTLIVDCAHATASRDTVLTDQLRKIDQALLDLGVTPEELRVVKAERMPQDRAGKMSDGPRC